MAVFYVSYSVPEEDWNNVRIFSGKIKPKKRMPWVYLGQALGDLAIAVIDMLGYLYSQPHWYDTVVKSIQEAINDLGYIADLITVGSNFQIAVLDRRVRFFNDQIRRHRLGEALKCYDYPSIHLTVGRYVLARMSHAVQEQYEPDRLVETVKECSDLLKDILYHTRLRLSYAEEEARKTCVPEGGPPDDLIKAESSEPEAASS